ncbi:MAG: O-antigen ligase family protein [Mycobacterium sp.]
MTRTEMYVGAAACILGPLAAVGAALGGKLGVIAIGGLLAMIVGVYVGMRHPMWLIYGMTISVTTLPFGYFPGVHVPLYLVFACGSLLALLLHPRAVRRHTTMMSAVLIMVLLSGLSMVFTFSSIVNIMDFTKWAVATSAMFVILALPAEQLLKVGRVFVYSCTFSALWGIAAVALGSTRLIVKPFQIFGYVAADRFYFTGGTSTLPKVGRFAVGQGSETFQRLGGLWLDPNAAGIGLVVGIAVAAIMFAGWQRVVIMTILAASIALTLSRAAMLSVLIGIALVFIFHNMRTRDRQVIIGALFLAFAAAMAVPAVRTRLLGSLGHNDAGASDRMAAIREFPGRMGDHWLFGWGWSLREFKDGAYAFEQNFVSNAPLIAVHRGGVIVGLSFVLVVAIGCVMAARLIRTNSLPHAFYGGVFIAFSVIALNLDHPVVVIAQITFLYTFFITFLIYSDELRRKGALDTPGVDTTKPLPDETVAEAKTVAAQGAPLPAAPA